MTSHEQELEMLKSMLILGILALLSAGIYSQCQEHQTICPEFITGVILKQIRQAQTSFKEKKMKDIDHDGSGEYAGNFMELKDEISLQPVPGHPHHAHYGNFIYCIYSSKDISSGGVDTDETAWACMAWPLARNYDHDRYASCYAIDTKGVVYTFRNTDGQFYGDDLPMHLDDLYGKGLQSDTIGAGKLHFETCP